MRIGSNNATEVLHATENTFAEYAWEEILRPHTWNAHDGSDEIAGYFRGIGWYRKHFTLGEDLRGKNCAGGGDRELAASEFAFLFAPGK